MAREQSRTHAPDYALLSVVAVLVVIGLVAVYSSSYVLGEAQFDDTNYFIKRQLIFALLGTAGLVVMMRLDYHHLSPLSPLVMLVALIALAAVLVPGIGVEANEARRWVRIGSLPPFQPSEFAKLAVIIYLAAWLAAKGDIVRSMTLGVAPFVVIVGLVGALIMREPDLGTAVMIAAITGSLFFVAGAKLSHVFLLLASTAAVGTLLVVTSGYRMNRILSFTSAEDDPSGVGFQTLQLLVAFGSGGIGGLGLGVSRQKFFYVPGSHTDGVFAIIGEEIGFIGVAVVLGLFVLLLWRGLQIVRRAPDKFGSLLATGVLAWIAFQLIMNVGGVTRALPLTGIPLPLLSYGGSSLAVTLTAIGLLLSVSRYAALTPEREAVAGRRRATTGGAR